MRDRSEDRAEEAFAVRYNLIHIHFKFILGADFFLALNANNDLPPSRSILVGNGPLGLPVSPVSRTITMANGFMHLSILRFQV